MSEKYTTSALRSETPIRQIQRVMFGFCKFTQRQHHIVGSQATGVLVISNENTGYRFGSHFGNQIAMHSRARQVFNESAKWNLVRCKGFSIAKLIGRRLHNSLMVSAFTNVPHHAVVLHGPWPTVRRHA